jgi:hypothetical protein
LAGNTFQWATLSLISFTLCANNASFLKGTLSEFKQLSTVQFNVFLADLRGGKLEERLANALEQKSDICNALKASNGNQRKWLTVIYYGMGSLNVKFEVEEVM